MEQVNLVCSSIILAEETSLEPTVSLINTALHCTMNFNAIKTGLLIFIVTAEARVKPNLLVALLSPLHLKKWKYPRYGVERSEIEKAGRGGHHGYLTCLGCLNFR